MTLRVHGAGCVLMKKHTFVPILLISQVIFDELKTRQKHNKSSAIWNTLVRIYLTNHHGGYKFICMTLFKRTLTALDLGAFDSVLMRTVASLAKPLGIAHLYLLHVMPDFTQPAHLDVEFYKLFNPNYPVDEKVRDKVKLDAAEHFGNAPGFEINTEVVEGKPYEKLIHWTEVKLIDLLVVGHKKISQGSGITAKRVARHTGTHVFYVPEEPAPSIRRLLVPLDFSDHGAKALRTATRLAASLEEAQVTALHVVPQPAAVFYEPAWESGAFQHALTESAQKSYRKFIEDHGLEEEAIEVRFLDDDYNSISRHVHEFAQTDGSDMIVIGAKGHTALNSLLFGSVTESLLERCRDRLILVVR